MSEMRIIVTIVVYLAAMLLVGFAYSKTNNDSADFYLGGRKMGPLVTAMSAEASDMSSWLLMGMPGLAYLTGIASPGWTAIGCCAGYLAQLAHRGPAAPPLFGQPRRHHSTAVLVASLP